MNRLRRQDCLVALAVALVISIASQMPQLSRLDGLSVDLLTWLRYEAFGPIHTPEESNVAVIAIDEETYRRPPFQNTPKALWTPHFAQIVTALEDAGAKVIGQDVILPTSIERYLPGHDRDYLLALRRVGGKGRLVLSQIQHTAKPISPHRGQIFALGGAAHLRIVNLFTDNDGIIRRVPVSFTRLIGSGERRLEASFAVELASRYLDEGLAEIGQGFANLGPKRLSSQGDSGILVNFAGGGQALPTYSFADIHACIEADRKDFLRQAFAGRVVLIGTALDVEDRKTTSARFVTGADGSWIAGRCVHEELPDLYDGNIVRSTIPGTFIFASFINNILMDQLLRELSLVQSAVLSGAAALFAATAAMLVSPAMLFAVVVGFALLWSTVATFAFQSDLFLPFLDPVAGSVVAATLMLGYRFGLTDRARRRVEQAFSYYLPPIVVERMVTEEALPRLGGEERELTVLMSDIAGFSRMSERMGPEQLVGAMNRYFDLAVERIEAHQGCVCAFVGDAVMALFGAPLHDRDHPLHAVEAALDGDVAMRTAGPMFGLSPGSRLNVRFGLATGPALIGNTGSTRRFNFTAMGDTVNLAARLETANKVYGTRILICDETARRVAEKIATMPLERVRVQGRDRPVVLHVPLGPWETLSPENNERLKRFKDAHELRDAGRYAQAKVAYEGVANDTAAAQLAQHLDFIREKTELWEGLPVFTLPGK